MLALRIMAIAVALLLAGLVAPVAAQEDKGESETDLMRNKIAQLEGDLAETRERRNYYQDRTVELKEENAALTEEIAVLEARIAELEGQDAEPVAAPQSTGMTADERAYLLASREVMGPALITALAATDIMQDPDFATDVVLWVSLVETLRPMHGYWAEIQVLSPPPRLGALQQAYVDWLYNMDQVATFIDVGVTNVDANAIVSATEHLESSTEALSRAHRHLNEYETEADVDVSTDLD